MPPKRPATTFTTDAPTDRAAAALAGKRVRYAPNNAETVAAEGTDDLELDLEQGGGGTKKRNVVTEGYDSDSSAGSDGGFGGAGGGRAGHGVGQQAAEPDDDEDDMFGGGPGVDRGMDVKGRKKEKDFLEMGDIEGQEFGKGDEDDEDDADDEGLEEEYEPEDDLANDDNAPRGRRSKKGMGYALSSFNMKEELNEGRFSADGSYVANDADPLAQHDAWLDGTSKKAIKAAREAKERMDARQRDKERDEARNEEQLTQLRDDCLIGLLKIVREGETVARALTRLGNAKKRAVEGEGGEHKPGAAAAAKGKGKTSGGDAMELDGDSAPAASDAPAPETPSQRYARKIERLTHLASTLLSSHGELEIYDQTHSDIIKTLKSEGAVRRDWVPPTDPDIALEEQEEADARRAKAEQHAAERAAGAGAGGGRSRVVIARPTGGAPPAPAGEAYHYRWLNPPEGQPPDQEYGPYDRATFEGWVAGGYFGDDAARITVRRAGGQELKSWKELR
ncbi:hypothetical protein JCM10207_007341 [Rhodosporidiobolus poonsookiae]